MPSVKVRENEPFEFALRRFKRTCEKAGVLAEVRKREFYEKPTQERKRKREVDYDAPEEDGDVKKEKKKKKRKDGEEDGEKKSKKKRKSEEVAAEA